MKNKRILVSAAHPDDADFYCGGSLSRWIADGAEVTYLICTDGALGTDDKNITREMLIKTRTGEQTAANRALGVRETVFLGYPDLSLQAGEELRLKIARVIRTVKPHILITFDPWAAYEIHPDHTVAGRETIYARLAARLHLRYPDLLAEGLDAWAIDDVYFMKTDRPNFWVDTEDFLGTKLQTLMCHQSQFGFLAADETAGMNILRHMSRKHPETGRIAESFHHMPLEGIEGLRAYVGF